MPNPAKPGAERGRNSVHPDHQKAEMNEIADTWLAQSKELAVARVGFLDFKCREGGKPSLRITKDALKAPHKQ